MSEQNFSQKIERPPASPESGLDQRNWEAPLSQRQSAEQTEQDLPLPVVTTSPASPVQSTKTDIYKDARLLEIERVLEQDLEQIYFDLPAESKLIFKNEGELTARKINALLAETKVAAQKIVDLLLAWLSLLPGVNKFFIEQEAKIKADKVLAMKNYER